ncbi:MAG TPA: hypothetical protein VE135_23390 [Pyrinomonadaceae bacterium]|nr:hypothetical protein [Pyrinomonadaceae bacterium]
MPIELPYGQTLELGISDSHYANSGPATVEFTQNDKSEPQATVQVYADAAKTQLIVDKTDKVHPVPPPGIDGDYYFQFTIHAGGANGPLRATAGYIPGSYNFAFAPAADPPITGLLTDPHRRPTEDDVEWTAEKPTPEDVDAAKAGGRGL